MDGTHLKNLFKIYSIPSSPLSLLLWPAMVPPVRRRWGVPISPGQKFFVLWWKAVTVRHAVIECLRAAPWGIAAKELWGTVPVSRRAPRLFSVRRELVWGRSRWRRWAAMWGRRSRREKVRGAAKAERWWWRWWRIPALREGKCYADLNRFFRRWRWPCRRKVSPRSHAPEIFRQWAKLGWEWRWRICRARMMLHPMAWMTNFGLTI